MPALLSVSRAPAFGSFVTGAAVCLPPSTAGFNGTTIVALPIARRGRRVRLVVESRRSVRHRRGPLVIASSSSDSNVAASETQAAAPTSPADAINLGLALFSKGRVLQHGIAPACSLHSFILSQLSTPMCRSPNLCARLLC